MKTATSQETNPLCLPPFDRPAFTIIPASEHINHAQIYILMARRAELEMQLHDADRAFTRAAKRVFRS